MMSTFAIYFNFPPFQVLAISVLSREEETEGDIAPLSLLPPPGIEQRKG